MKNTYISKFKNYMSPIPEATISLWDWLNDDSLKKDVEFIRTVKNKDERSQLKSKLPGVTVSGTFTQRKASCLIKHSEFICIDIDSKENPSVTNFEELKNKLKNILNVAYCGISVSGQGVFCIIPIKYPEKHKEHFEALKMCFDKLGIIIDKSCADVSRLRGYSYDPNAYFNENPEMFFQYFDYRKSIENRLSEDSNSQIEINASENFTKRKVMEIINKIQKTSIDITEKYEQWFQIGCALANEFGEEGREMFDLVSQNHPKYHPDVVDSKFSDCLNSPYSYYIGTFFHWAEEYGLI